MGTLDSEGKQTNSMEEMKSRAVSYFTSLFSSSPRQTPIPNLNITIEGKWSEIENAKLRAYPDSAEVWKALNGMPNGKASGMDGISSEIISKH